MCKCSNNGRNLLRCNDDVWDKNIDDLDESLSELDVISIKLYQIASRRAEKLLPQINTMLEFVDEEKRKEVKSTLINFRASVRKLINNEENSIIVYKNQLGTVKELIKRKRVSVNNQLISISDYKVNPEPAVQWHFRKW